MADQHSPDAYLLFHPLGEEAIGRITQPDRTVAIAEYDLTCWLPLLGPERWVLVHRLRASYLSGPHGQTPGGRAVIQTDLATLVNDLGLPRSRIKAILASEPIDGDAPWRQLRIWERGQRSQQERRFSLNLRFFIPRLRYHYVPAPESRPPARAGLVLELVLDLLPTPQDAVRLGLSLKALQNFEPEPQPDPSSLKALQASQAADDSQSPARLSAASDGQEVAGSGAVSGPERVAQARETAAPAQGSTPTAAATSNGELEVYQEIWRHFAARQGEAVYHPSRSDGKALVRLRQDGFTPHEIKAGVDCAFAQSQVIRRRGRIQRFTYCETAIRRTRSFQQASESRTELVAHYALTKATLAGIAVEQAVNSWERQRLEQLANYYEPIARRGNPPAGGADWVLAAIDEAGASPGTYSLSIRLLETILERWQRDGFRAARQFARRPQDRERRRPLAAGWPEFATELSADRQPADPLESMWAAAADQLALEMTAATHAQLIRPLKPLRWEDDALIMQADSPQALAWLVGRFRSPVEKAIAWAAGAEGVRVRFVLADEPARPREGD